MILCGSTTNTGGRYEFVTFVDVGHPMPDLCGDRSLSTGDMGHRETKWDCLHLS